MAYIDKIYGTKEQWKELKNFLHKNGKTQWVNDFMYPEPEKEGPISNFSKEADMWLLENCPLEFVIERLKEQYKKK